MNNIVGVLLAGGLARRMGGGDKSLSMLGGRSMLARIIERVRPQVSKLMINANGDAGRFAAYDLDVIPDVIGDFAGPLAGVLTGLEWSAVNAPGTEWVATFATDAPFVPTDLVARLQGAVEEAGAELACAASNGRPHPVFGLWPISLAADLRRAMIEEDMRKIDLWTARYQLIEVDFSTQSFDPFFNINDKDNLAEAERLLATKERGAA
ncbi:MAG: molybdenum cofactor guanylyltransferase MobA [Proteobacteria bacterium]|nr:molybdenum cofactor guanylyltransferase MobA [Pseudomonadota bacterium]